MTGWEAICREKVQWAQSGAARDPHPSNWSSVRYWKRKLWWARFGVYISAALGSSIGVGIVLLVEHLLT